MVERLEITQGEPVLLIDRVRTADGKPVSISIDYLALARLRCSDDLEDCINHFQSYLHSYQSIYSYFEDEMGLVRGYATAWLRPMVADLDMAQKLKVPIHSPILYISSWI